MNAAVRPYATAGVALVGASVIAISPLAPPMPGAQAMQRAASSVSVELSAAVDPIQNWIQVFQKSAANLSALGQQIAASPAPILSQIVVNQMAALKALQAAFDSNSAVVKQIVDSIPGVVDTARNQLQSGNIKGAVSTINDQVVIPLVLAGVTAVSDLTRPLVSTVNNFAKAFATLPEAVFQVILPITYPLVSTINVVVQATQDVYDGVVARDPGAVANTLVNLPANLVDGFLNGSGTILGGFINAPGLLTPYDPSLGFLASGPISSLIALRDVIAQAIGATPPPTAAITSAAATVPTAAKTVTLSTAAPEATGTASTAKGVTKAASESAAESTDAADAEATESATGSTGSTTTGTKATPSGSATGGSDSSSSDTKAGSSATGGSDSKASAGKKGSGKSARSAKASK
ncbi:hypothetical protein [Mycobacterium sp. EPa45]|uniref:hypothetical protein n=1 Tax=Mycobacterium sp. EPa45 TaxID=1545728 RepID=UPI000642266C|nr:hypothetical protein [Mycobacterium sp. EPa45]AKK26305.1 hypothetical protein AB431_05900 [Mycobacterium sp. EPa45]